MLAAADAPVVEVPQLGPLVLRVPLADVVAEGEDALLRARALLVAARAAERGVEAVLGDRVEQRHRLQPVARRVRPGLLDRAALVDRLLHGGDDQPLAELGDAALDEVGDLGELVPGRDLHEREREAAGAERLLGEAQQDDRVLAAAEQQHGPLELGGDLAHDVDRLALERVEVRKLVAHRATAILGAGGASAPARRRCRSHATTPTASGHADDARRAGSSTPALLSTPSAAPSSTTPSAGRSAVDRDARQQRGADPHAGDRAEQDRPHQGEVDVAADQVRERRRSTAAPRRGRRRCRRRGAG